MMKKILSNKQDRRIRLTKVKKLTGLGKTKIYELMAAGKFPPSYKFEDSTDVYWLYSEIQAYVRREWYPGWTTPVNDVVDSTTPDQSSTSSTAPENPRETGLQPHYTFIHVENNFIFHQPEGINYLSEIIRWLKVVSSKATVRDVYRYPQFLIAWLVAANKDVNDFCLRRIPGLKYLDQHAWLRIPLAVALHVAFIFNFYYNPVNSIVIG
jgi:predicted DNA-binding transcriptional regulator AlpA